MVLWPGPLSTNLGRASHWVTASTVMEHEAVAPEARRRGCGFPLRRAPCRQTRMRAFLIIWGLPPTGPRAGVRPRRRWDSSVAGVPVPPSVGPMQG